MQTSDTSASRKAIYNEPIPAPAPVVFSPGSPCVGRHNNPVVEVSAYSGHLYCDECLAFKSNQFALRCGCCNAVVGSDSQNRFTNCVPISRSHPQRNPEYRCTFCVNSWVTSEAEEDFKTCYQQARSWFQLFLEWGSQTATSNPTARWTTLTSQISLSLVDLDTMMGKEGNVVGVTDSEMYNTSDYIHYISILSHLHKMQLVTVMVHELTHCWQGENDITSVVLGKMLFEGFAEWVSYKYLQWLWCTSQVDATKLEIQELVALKCQDTSNYGTGLRWWLSYEKLVNNFADFWLKATGKL